MTTPDRSTILAFNQNIETSRRFLALRAGVLLWLAAAAAQAQTVTATIAVGTGPQVLALNPVTNKIYVANAASNNVTVHRRGHQYQNHGKTSAALPKRLPSTPTQTRST